jgi:hypothetical protein
MPRQADEIVEEIRARRQRVARDLSDLTSVRELERRVRSAPELWLVGTAVAGIIAGRFFAGPLLRRGRRTVSDFARGQLRSALVALGVAIAGRVAGDHRGDGAGPLFDRGGAPEPEARQTSRR